MEPTERTCPWCGKPMQAGYIPARDKLYWQKDNGYFTPLASGKGLKRLFQPAVPEAWACLDCGKVVIDLETPVMGAGLAAPRTAD